MTKEILIRAERLNKEFPVRASQYPKNAKIIPALDNISLSIFRGENFGLIGESGCGKTTLGKIILRLLTPESGNVYYKDKEVFSLKKTELLFFRKKAQIIFQDPYSSLNPAMTIGAALKEVLLFHEISDKKSVLSKALELLQLVGLSDGAIKKYPHEFSGGQCQRIVIARSLASKPEFLVCDEPVSSLDLSAQAQIINLLFKIQKLFNLTSLFISHDLNLVKNFSDRIAVMFKGNIIELAATEELHNNPLHPYTKKLFEAANFFQGKAKIDSFLKTSEEEIIFENFPCPYTERCPEKMEKCCKSKPELLTLKNDHSVACFLYSP